MAYAYKILAQGTAASGTSTTTYVLVNSYTVPSGKSAIINKATLSAQAEYTGTDVWKYRVRIVPSGSATSDTYNFIVSSSQSAGMWPNLDRTYHHIDFTRNAVVNANSGPLASISLSSGDKIEIYIAGGQTSITVNSFIFGVEIS